LVFFSFPAEANLAYSGSLTLEERWHYGVLPGKPVSPATKVDLSVDLGELPDCHTSVTASGNGTDVSAALAAAVECPRFVRCRGELRSVAYCQEASVRVIPKDSRSAGLRYMAQVLVLEKVFVDHRGQVTDERLWYSLGGCEVPYEPFPSAPLHLNRVSKFPMVVNLMISKKDRLLDVVSDVLLSPEEGPGHVPDRHTDHQHQPGAPKVAQIPRPGRAAAQRRPRHQDRVLRLCPHTGGSLTT